MWVRVERESGSELVGWNKKIVFYWYGCAGWVLLLEQIKDAFLGG
jgi:hypothetical protein